MNMCSAAPSPAATGNPQTFDRAQIVHAQEMEILGSRELREKTLNEIGLSRVYPKTRRRRRQRTCCWNSWVAI